MKARCPKGHTKGLQIRKICDFPVTGVNKDYVDFDEKQAPIDIDWEAKMLGTSCGVWCSTCDEWYLESTIIEASMTRKTK